MREKNEFATVRLFGEDYKPSSFIEGYWCFPPSFVGMKDEISGKVFELFDGAARLPLK